MTRAKTGLFLTGALDYGGTRDKKPSQFVTELNLLSKEKDKVKKVAKKVRLEKTKSAKIGVTKTDNKIKLPDKFSFTQIEAFKKCPLQYKYSHILRIPVKGKHTFSFGKSIHATLQKFFELVRAQATNKQGDLFDAKTNSGETTARGKD